MTPRTQESATIMVLFKGYNSETAKWKIHRQVWGVAGTDFHVLSFWDRHATLLEHRCLNQPGSSLSLIVSVFLLKFYYMGTIE